MKYLHLTQWSPRVSFGGYETIVRDTAAFQANHGHAVFVVGRIEGPRHRIHHVRVGNVMYVEVAFPARRRPSTLSVGLWGYILLIAEIFISIWLLTPVVLDILSKEQLDAVIFYGIHLVLMAPIIRWHGGKAVLGLEVLQKNQDVSPSSFLYWFRRVKYACFNGIFTYTKHFIIDGVSYNNLALLKKYAPHIPVIYIPWGIDVAATRRVGSDTKLALFKKKTQSKIILCPRRLVEEKGVRYLLEAIPEVMRRIPKAYFIFAGDGILRPDMERRVSELGISRNVRFTGFIHHDRVLSMMRTSDVVVVPSSGEESFGMVFLEAYALKIPIVSTTFGGITNVVSDGTTGILVTPKKSQELANAIVSVLKNHNRKEQFIKNGEKRLFGEFTIEKTLGRLDKFVTSI